jgi:hypothetical protein
MATFIQSTVTLGLYTKHHNIYLKQIFVFCYINHLHKFNINELGDVEDRV